MRQLLSVLMALLLVPAVAWSASITRSTKNNSGNGGTDFVNGKPLDASELNEDFDNIYNEFNGSIDNANIKAAAAIAWSKIDTNLQVTNSDVSATAAIAVSKLDQTAGLLDADIVGDFAENDAEFWTVTDPGSSDSTAPLPLNLEEEIARLRYAIKRLAVGINAQLVDATDAANWTDEPVVGQNLLRNASFEAQTGGAGTAPDGWALVDTPATAALAETDVALGEGKEINLVAGASTAEGIEQSLAGLRASTLYLVGVYAKAATGSDTCRLVTNGADSGTFTDLDLSTSSTTYTLLSGIVSTDSTPTALDVELLSDVNAQADDCDFDHAYVVRLGDDPTPSPSRVALVDEDLSASQLIDRTADVCPTYQVLSNTVSVTVPGPGYAIRAMGSALITQSSTGNVYGLMRLERDGSQAGSSIGWSITNADDIDDHGDSGTVHSLFTSPVPGTTYDYTLSACHASGAGEATNEEYTLSVELIPPQ